MKLIKWEKENQALIRLFAIVGSWLLLYISIVIFFTVYINGYSTEKVIIYINAYGEKLYETIMFGCVIVISLISFVYSVISTILHFKNEKKIRREKENDTC